MAKYLSTSFYYTTPQSPQFMGLWSARYIPAFDDDYELDITPQYDRKPWNLASKLYGKRDLDWVFMRRNPDIIHHPIYDFKAGTTIIVPTRNDLYSILGV